MNTFITFATEVAAAHQHFLSHLPSRSPYVPSSTAAPVMVTSPHHMHIAAWLRAHIVNVIGWHGSHHKQTYLWQGYTGWSRAPESRTYVPLGLCSGLHSHHTCSTLNVPSLEKPSLNSSDFGQPPFMFCHSNVYFVLRVHAKVIMAHLLMWASIRQKLSL